MTFVAMLSRRTICFKAANQIFSTDNKLSAADMPEAFCRLGSADFPALNGFLEQFNREAELVIRLAFLSGQRHKLAMKWLFHEPPKINLVACPLIRHEASFTWRSGGEQEFFQSKAPTKPRRFSDSFSVRDSSSHRG